MILRILNSSKLAEKLENIIEHENTEIKEFYYDIIVNFFETY